MGVWDLLVPEKKCARSPYYPLLLKFYVRYVDDSLLLEKEDGKNDIFYQFNLFHDNLKFTIDFLEGQSY